MNSSLPRTQMILLLRWISEPPRSSSLSCPRSAAAAADTEPCRPPYWHHLWGNTSLLPRGETLWTSLLQVLSTTQNKLHVFFFLLQKQMSVNILFCFHWEKNLKPKGGFMIEPLKSEIPLHGWRLYFKEQFYYSESTHSKVYKYSVTSKSTA